MSFLVVFKSTCGDEGGLAVVNSGWLTPMKKECFWPPYKDKDKFNTALKHNAKVEDSTWKLFPVSRIFFESGKYKSDLIEIDGA